MVTQVDSPAVEVLEVADDPRLSREVKAFLKVLNSGGVDLETLPPLEARQVLADAQASVPIDLSGIEEASVIGSNRFFGYQLSGILVLIRFWSS
jgi:acetyl esterase